MSQLYSRINDEIIKADTASVLLSDMALQRGYGIFDFFKIIDNQPVFLEEHLGRFYQSAQAMQLAVNKSAEELAAIIHELIQLNQLPQSGMRITLTGGYAADGYSTQQPNLLLVQQPLTLATSLQPGIRLMIYAHQRQLPQVKTIDYLMAVWLQPHIRRQGAADVLYHQQGIVTECPRANFFIVNKNNELATPAANILEGITRKKVLQLAKKHIAVKEGTVTLADIYEAKEAFITSTTKHLLPVVQIDDNIIGDGKPGVVTRSLFEELAAIVFNS
ncbi:MAG TPA: aminotransferase class IV [Chitinophagaceae bacterium]|nr:aminotransferase class IV [Chitinophagaceae bacterium]